MNVVEIKFVSHQGFVVIERMNSNGMHVQSYANGQRALVDKDGYIYGMFIDGIWEISGAPRDRIKEYARVTEFRDYFDLDDISEKPVMGMSPIIDNRYAPSWSRVKNYHVIAAIDEAPQELVDRIRGGEKTA